MLETYPKADARFNSPASEKHGALLAEMIKDVRGYKAAEKMAPNEPIKLVLSPKTPFAGIEEYLKRFLFAKEVRFEKEPPAGETRVYHGCTMVIELDKNPAEIAEGLKKELANLENEILRGEKMLGNPGFIAKAPKEKIDLEKEKLAANKAKREEVLQRLNSL